MSSLDERAERVRKQRVAAAIRCRKRKQQFIHDFKAARGCARCPERRPVCLDLHHSNPEEKHDLLRWWHENADGVRRRRSSVNWPDLNWDDLRSEIEKCEVICANCHRVETARERGWYAEAV